MSDNIVIAGPVAYLTTANSAVYFKPTANSAGTFVSSGTAAPVKKLETALEVAPWGEDNRFPQNINNQLAYCGIAKSALDWKARALWGNGIIPGKVKGYEKNGLEEIFEPLDPSKYKKIYDFINARGFYRFWLEYTQDWTHYGNCFPEIIFSYDTKYITGFVHQESCDCRYKQMNKQGNIETVYLSKLWGAAKDQFAQFDPKKSIKGLIENPKTIYEVDGNLVKALDCIDMYNALQSTKAIAAKLKKSRKLKAFKSAILPVNYPSSNKTYYQVPYWDGARLGGWIEIASKIPNLYKALYNNAFRIKYHIEVPDTYFEDKYGAEKWDAMTEPEKLKAKQDLLADMQNFLAGDDNAYKTFVSFFSVDPVSKKEYGQVKITPVKDESNIDKDLILSSSAAVEILMAMQVHPALFSAGMTGSAYRSGGGSGSDIREAYLVYTSLLNLERNVLLEPLYLAKDYNRVVGGVSEWEEDIVFRFRDTVLTTVDKGKGTEKKVS